MRRKDKVIATADFIANGVSALGYKADNEKVHMELRKAPDNFAVDESILVFSVGRTRRFVNTRCEGSPLPDGSNFQEWAYKWLRENTCKRISIEKA